MPIQKIPFQPGVNKEGTQYSADLGWFDSDKVRFRKGRVEKIGGWQKLSSSAVSGIPRALKDWGTNNFKNYLAVGTTYKMYVEQGGSYTDITPIRVVNQNTATFSTVSGSSTITVNDPSHGAKQFDYVEFTNAVDLGGGSGIVAADINQEYQIQTIVDNSNYTITCRDATTQQEKNAQATVSGAGGSATDATYQINVGLNQGSTPIISSWGSNSWGSGAWGIGAGIDPSEQLRLYGQDIFANDLIFNVRSGGVYYWDESVGGRAKDISDSSAFPSAVSPPRS